MVQSATALRSLTSPAETGVVTADFGRMLAAGVTITSVNTVSIGVFPNLYFPGQDAAAASRLLGAPQIVASPSTGAASAAIAQRVGTFLPAVRYAIQIIGNASDGSVPELWQYWTADYPGMPGGAGPSG